MNKKSKRNAYRSMMSRPMPFGKYKNRPVNDVPTGYIEWFIRNIDSWDDLKAVMQEVLIDRWESEQPSRDLDSEYRDILGPPNLPKPVNVPF